MAEYLIQGPDGQKFKITAPEGASEDDIMSFVQQQFGGQETEKDPYEEAGLKPDLTPVQAQEIIKGLPKDKQKEYLKKWAKSYVQDQRSKASDTVLGSIGQAVDDKVRQFGDYALGGGYSDEINAGIYSLFGDEDYDTELAIERAIKEEVAKGDDKPIVSTPLGDIYGSGLAKAAGLVGSSVALPFGTGIKSAKGLAGLGAATGAVEQFGQGEGLADRATKALGGAATGALVGGTVGKVANSEMVKDAAGKVADFASNAGRKVMGAKPDTVAGAKIAQAMDNQNMSAPQAQAELARMQAAGKPATIADLGPALQREARNAKVASKEVDAIAEPQLIERAQTQVNRIDTDLRRTMRIGERDFKGDFDQIVANRQKISKPLYKRAFKTARPVDISEEINGLRAIANQEVDKTARNQLNRVANFFLTKDKKGKEVIRSGLRELHKGKLSLDAMLGKSAANPTSADNNAKAILTGFKNRLLAKIDDVNPDYAKARSVFSDSKRLEDALENGRSFLRGDAEFLVDDIARLPQTERELFRVGVVRELNKMMGGRKIGNDLTQIFEKPNMANALRATFPDDQSFRKFYSDIADEVAFNATKNKVLGGSQTAEKMQDMADLSMFRRFIQNAKNQGFAQTIMNGVLDVMEKSLRMNQKDATAIGKMLFEADPAKQREILKEIGKKMGNSKMRKVRRAIARKTADMFTDYHLAQRATVAASSE